MLDIENELVHQKDAIIALINEDEFEQATNLLNFSSELWYKASYGYKHKELRQRVRVAVQDKIAHSDAHQTRSKWERTLARLPQ